MKILANIGHMIGRYCLLVVFIVVVLSSITTVTGLENISTSSVQYYLIACLIAIIYVSYLVIRYQFKRDTKKEKE